MADLLWRGLFINGRWTPASGGKTIPVINPATEETIAEASYGDRSDVAKAIDAAHAAMPAWAALTAYDRAKVLKKTADLMRERSAAIAKDLTTEQGKPLAEARAEVNHVADTFEWFAEEGKRAYGRVIPPSMPGKRHLTLRHPVGVVGAIGPWNFPITQLSRKIAPALAAGCTVVAKPAEQTPLSLCNVLDCMVEAGLPAGVVNYVLAPAEQVGDEFFDNRKVRKVSFTGSTAVGKILLGKSAAQVKRLSLELGGHAPLIVFPDADPEAVAKAAVAGKFRNNGQVCISPSRFYVHESLRKDFTEAAVEAAKKLKQGNGLEAGIDLGPMVEQRGLDKATGLVGDAMAKGAKVLAGGGRSPKFAKGFFFEPTILTDIPDGAKLLADEPFAPVMPIMEFSNLDEVIRRANDTPYGLAAYVFTNDLSTALKMADGLEAGIIGINDPVPAAPQCPFGGMKESGLGRENGSEGLDAYFETKYVSIKLRD